MGKTSSGKPTVSAESVSRRADRYIGRPYEEIDCQQLWENCLEDAGIRLNLAGSNAWYRKMDWTGTPEECVRKFGCIPKGAALFILKLDGREPGKYHSDGIGNASHIGIYTGRGRGAIHASASKGLVCESEFRGRTIPNGGWNRVGLWKKLSYGDKIDRLLNGGGEEIRMETMIVTAEKGKTVRMRSTPAVAKNELCNVPIGARVEAGPDQNGWREIVWEDTAGWMMSAFLTPADTAPATPSDIPAAPSGYVRTLTTDELNRLCGARDRIEDALKTLKSIVGVG